jgi:translation initiation factor 2D
LNNAPLELSQFSEEETGEGDEEAKAPAEGQYEPGMPSAATAEAPPKASNEDPAPITQAANDDDADANENEDGDDATPADSAAGSSADAKGADCSAFLCFDGLSDSVVFYLRIDSRQHADSGFRASQIPPHSEMDELLYISLLNALSLTIKDSDLPMPPSILYSQMIPCRPKGTTLDIKKSSHKKV